MLPLRFLGISMLNDMPAAEDGVIRPGKDIELHWFSSTSTSSETDKRQWTVTVCKQSWYAPFLRPHLLQHSFKQLPSVHTLKKMCNIYMLQVIKSSSPLKKWHLNTMKLQTLLSDCDWQAAVIPERGWGVIAEINNIYTCVFCQADNLLIQWRISGCWILIKRTTSGICRALSYFLVRWVNV